MNFNYRYFNLCSVVLTLTFVSSTALFCSELSSDGDKDTPCFLESSTHNPVILRTSSNSLVLPCHVAHSKRSSVEWWYTDAQKLINFKIFPVLPAVRPTVLRFVTSLSSYSKTSNETDITDASILLRHVNVDDSGIYRCIIRPWTVDPINHIEANLFDNDSDAPSLSYQIQLTGPRLCQSSSGTLPCFSSILTSSPTIIDAYQTAYLPCVVNNYKRPTNVFWVIGNASVNSVLITNHLATNEYKGDQLRRVFPFSQFDYSVELSIDRNSYERVYSCVIDGATDAETTLFTYIVHTTDLEEVVEKNTNGKKIIAHDALNRQEIDSLRENKKGKKEDVSEEADLFGLDRSEETATKN